jgi:hypothetical protein
LKNSRFRSKESFRFYTRLHLTELLGMKVSTLPELLACVRSVPGSSIYHHTHRFLQQHLFLNPEPPNDFSYWVDEALSEKALGERLASIDTVQFRDIRGLREAIALTLVTHLAQNPRAAEKHADPGEELHLMKSVSFILPTRYEASTLPEFGAMIESVSVDSIYFHMFESRLRLENPTNDFSRWLSESLDERALAEEVSKIDPYTHTLEGLRHSLLKGIQKRLKTSHG